MVTFQRDFLAPKHAHLWIVDLDAVTDETRGRLSASLSEAEFQRASRYAFEHDRRRFMTCRGLLRFALWSYLQIDSRELRIEQNEWGKPFLSEWPLSFNVSHSEGAALLAFTQEGDIGVDIEHVHEHIDVMALAQNCFSSAERHELASFAEERRAEAFVACWTRKEAYIKACGQGLSLDLRSFGVSLEPMTSSWSLKTQSRDVSHEWSLRSFWPHARCAAAAAVHSPDCEISLYCWNWQLWSLNKMKLPPSPEGVPLTADVSSLT
jgi:4'-phosphopantetheinyl transferase